MTTIYDVFINLINLIQDIMPAVIAIISILIGKWIEKRNENEKLKREIYFEANRVLSRYKDIYWMFPLNEDNEKDNKNIQLQRWLYEQQMLSRDAKSDLEIIGSDEAVKLYIDCLDCIYKKGKEILSKKQEGEISTNIANNTKETLSYKNFLNLWCKWNNIIRKDLKIIK